MICVGVEEDEIFGEGGGTGCDFAVGGEDDGGAVEDEGVVAADLVDHDDEGTVTASDGGEHVPAKVALAAPEGRGGDVEDDARVDGDGVGQDGPLAHEFVDRVDGVEAARPEALVIPRVLADGDGEGLAVEHGEGLVGGGLEVTLLVEDVVEGEQHFLLEEGDAAVGEEGGDVARMLACGWVAFGGEGDAAENCGAAGGGGCDLFERLLGAGEEGGFFEEVGGRVAADGEFGEDYKVGGLGGGTRGEVEDEAAVAGEVADGRVDLGESDLHEFKFTASMGLGASQRFVQAERERMEA